MNTSPYADKVVVLLDKTKNSHTNAKIKDIKNSVKDRLFVLSEPTIEEYIPEYIFTKSGRKKADDLLEIEESKKEKKIKTDTGLSRLNNIKRQVATAISETLEASDLDNIPIIRDAIMKAAQMWIYFSGRF